MFKRLFRLNLQVFLTRDSWFYLYKSEESGVIKNFMLNGNPVQITVEPLKNSWNGPKSPEIRLLSTPTPRVRQVHPLLSCIPILRVKKHIYLQPKVGWVKVWTPKTFKKGPKPPLDVLNPPHFDSNSTNLWSTACFYSMVQQGRCTCIYTKITGCRLCKMIDP